MPITHAQLQALLQQACHLKAASKIVSLGVMFAGFGLDGAAWAVNLVQVTSTIGIGGYIIWRERQLRGTEMQTWHGW